MTSSMSIGTAPVAANKKKKKKVDTPYSGSWADTMKTTDWKKLQPKQDWVRVSNESLLTRSSKVIDSILSEAEKLGPSGLNEFRGTGKYNFEAPDRPRRRSIRVGDYVKGVMGIHGHSSGIVTKIGPPNSSSGSPTVWVRSEGGEEWDTFAFNLVTAD